MAIQLGTAVRNAMADAYEGAIGTSPTLELRTGAAPANCAAADSGTLVATITLPSDWAAGGSSGSKTLLGTWTALASGTGIVEHYRIKQGATCHEQGSVAESAADMVLDNNDVNAGQAITITAKTFTVGGA